MLVKKDTTAEFRSPQAKQDNRVESIFIIFRKLYQLRVYGIMSDQANKIYQKSNAKEA